ncbi:hypothetical protein BKA66DRAFT_382149, partial [Pyrenochaeta sp. MPI-SDFR-AT-0127]
GNARRGPNLTPLQRQAIISKAEAGVSVAELVAEFKRSLNCIHTTIRLAKTRTTRDEAPRSRRPPVLSHHQKRIIYRTARAQPKIEYSELAQASVVVNQDGTSSKPVSRSTLYQTLKRQGLTNYRCKK